jgi:putative transposase
MPATAKLSEPLAVEPLQRSVVLDTRGWYNASVPALKRNSGAVFSLKFHIVWCPKYRKPVLVGDVAERLKALLAEKAAELGAVVHALEVMPDHVHLFVESDPTFSPSHLANQFKGFTSHVLRSEFPHLRSRLPTLWSRSYFAASVGHVTDAAVKRYIDTQWEREKS